MSEPNKALAALALAYKPMTAAEIAEHALGLAHLLDVQHKSFLRVINATRSLQTSVRQVNNLFAMHRKREARELLANIADIREFYYGEMPDLSVIFDPFSEGKGDA